MINEKTLPSAPRSALNIPDLGRLRVLLNRARHQRRFGDRQSRDAACGRLQEGIEQLRLQGPLARKTEAALQILGASLKVELHWPCYADMEESLLRTDQVREDFKTAVSIFAQFLGRDGSGYHRNNYAFALEQLGESEKARVEWVSAATSIENRRKSHPLSVSLAIDLAENLEGQRKVSDAIEVYWTAACQLFDEDRAAQARLVVEWILRRLPMTPEQRERALKLGAEVLVRLSDIETDKEREHIQSAVALLKQAVDLRGQNADALAVRRAQLLLDLNDKDREALSVIENVRESNADPIQYWSTLAECRRRCMDYNGALVAVDKLLEKDEKDPWASATKGQILVAKAKLPKSKDFIEQAIQCLDTAVGSDCELNWMSAELVDALFVEGSPKSLARLEQLLDCITNEEGQDYWILAKRGKLQRCHNDLDASVESFAQAVGRLDDLATETGVQVDREDAWVYAEYGETLRVLGRYDDAVKILDRALLLDTKYAWASRIKAAVLNAMGRQREALAALDASGEADNYSGHALRGWILSDLACYKEACDAYLQATNSGADEEWVWGFYGWALECLGEERAEETIQAYGNALNHGPKNRSWKIGAANAKFLLDDWRGKAIEDYKNLLEDFANGQDRDASTSRAWCLYRLGRPSEAIDVYLTSLSEDEDSIATRFDLGLCYLAREEWENARMQYDFAAARAVTGSGIRTLDLMHIALEDLRQHYRTISSLPPPAAVCVIALLKERFDRAQTSIALGFKPKSTPALEFAEKHRSFVENNRSQPTVFGAVPAVCNVATVS